MRFWSFFVSVRCRIPHGPRICRPVTVYAAPACACLLSCRIYAKIHSKLPAAILNPKQYFPQMILRISAKTGRAANVQSNRISEASGEEMPYRHKENKTHQYSPHDYRFQLCRHINLFRSEAALLLPPESVKLVVL